MSRALKTQRITEDYLERGVDRFRATLFAQDLRPSQARDAVARCALQQAGSFSVEDLVRGMLDRGMRGAHFATVYRAMPLLVDAGIVRATQVGQGDAKHYEVAFEREQGAHLLCSQCGRTVEFPASELKLEQHKLARRFGFELDPGTIQLRGHCPKCR
jgi:Fur family transcriptional regulator, ferric uptake regulator